MIEHPRPLPEPRLATPNGAQPAFPLAPPKAHSPAPPAPPPGSEAGRRIQDPAQPARVLIWDWPVRIGHWALAVLFTLAWLTGDSEEWRLVHATLGGALLGLVLFRLLWGFMGSHHARFSSFVRGRQAVFAYVQGLLSAPFGRKVEGEVHEFLATAMLWIVIIHILGVLVSSLAHGENLIAAMFNGYKRGRPAEAITRTYGLLVPLVLAWSGFCAWLVTR